MKFENIYSFIEKDAFSTCRLAKKRIYYIYTYRKFNPYILNRIFADSILPRHRPCPAFRQRYLFILLKSFKRRTCL